LQVAGYGSAHLAGDLIASAPVLGSFAYNAPELTNSGIASPKSDVFSLGVILLELLTGKRPVDTSQPKRQQSLLTWVSAPGVTSLYSRRQVRYKGPSALSYVKCLQ
jgi:serine/threonine protein kinase